MPHSEGLSQIQNNVLIILKHRDNCWIYMLSSAQYICFNQTLPLWTINTKSPTSVYKNPIHIYHSVRTVSDIFFAKTWWISMKHACIRQPWTFIRMCEFFPTGQQRQLIASSIWVRLCLVLSLDFIVRKMTGSRAYPYT